MKRLTKCLVTSSICFLLLAATTRLLAQDVPRVQGKISSSTEGPRFTLEWESVPDRTYKIQAVEAIATNAPWITIDRVTSTTTGPLKWMAPESMGNRFFYRLIAPEPEIFSVEPSMIVAGTRADIYIAGQDFGSNDVLRLVGPGGLIILTNLDISGSTAIRASFLPDLAGDYRLELVSSLVVKTSILQQALTVLPAVNDQPTGQLTLWEPPHDPPASPVCIGSGPGSGKVNFQDLSVMKRSGGGKVSVQDISMTKRTGSGKVSVQDISMMKRGTGKVNVQDINFTKGNAPGKVSVQDLSFTADCDDGSVLMNNWPGTFELMPYSAEIQHEIVDIYVLGCGLDFIWTRTYRSRTGTNTLMGSGWTHSYDIHWSDASGHFDLWDGQGRIDRYTRQTNGVYACPGFFNEGIISNGVLKLVFADTGFWEFCPMDASASAGKISRSVDRNGNAMNFYYDSQGRLSEIVDTLDRTNHIVYGSDGMIQSVVDFSGRAVTYSYTASFSGGTISRDLTTVTSPPVTGTPNGNDFPQGKTISYVYSTGFQDDRLNHNLTQVIDGKNQTWLQVFYRTNLVSTNGNFDAVDYVQYGPYRTHLRRALLTPSPDNQFAVMKAIIKDGAGNVSECYYDSLNRCVRQLEFTGRSNPDLPVTPTQNRPTGKLRVDDPDYFETRWTWNRDSLLITALPPRGNLYQFVYESDLDRNASPRKRGDLRVVRETPAIGGADTDGDGVPDLLVRSVHYTYDPSFGCPASDCRAAQKLYCFGIRVTDDASYRKYNKGWDGTVKGRIAGGDGNDIIIGDYMAFSPQGSTQSRTRKGWDGLIYGNHKRSSEQAISGDSGGLDADYPISAASSRKGWDGKIKGSGSSYDCASGQCRAFCTSMTDPRGMVVKSSYDSHGNCIRFQCTGIPANQSPVIDFAYNAFGQLAYITNAADANNQRRVDGFTYFDSGAQKGRLQSVTLNHGGRNSHASFEYDPTGSLTRWVDPRGFDWRFTNNALGQLVSRTTPNTSFGSLVRCTTLFTYDANDNLVQVDQENRDSLGVLDPAFAYWTSHTAFDSLNRPSLVAHELTHTVQQRSLTNRFFYDANNNIILIQLPEAVSGSDPFNTITCDYDERNLPLRITRATGLSLATADEFDYDLNGNLKLVRSGVATGAGAAAGAATMAFQYDGFNRCVLWTDAMGNNRIRCFDANDNLRYERIDGETNDLAGSTLNQRLAECRYEYDPLNRCLKKRYSFFDIFTELAIGDGESTTTFTYAPNGLPLSVTDDNGNVTQFAYDTLHLVSSIRDARDNFIQMACDDAGNITQVTSIETSDVSQVKKTYVVPHVLDSMGRCVSLADNQGNTTQYAYDSRGNCVSVIDPNGNETVAVYDGLGRITDITRYEGFKERGITINTSHVEYQNNRCVSHTDANGNTTIFAYDSLDRAVTITHPDQTVESLIWSPRSNLSVYGDRNGTVTTFSYDLLDRCVRKDILPGPGVDNATTFEQFAYDGVGHLVLGTNNVSMVEFGFDSMGNCTRSKADCLAASAVFDGIGNRLQLACPGGRLFQFQYGRGGLLSAVGTIPFVGGALSSLGSFSYEGPGRLAGISRANGIETVVTWRGAVSPPNNPGDFGWLQPGQLTHRRSVSIVYYDRFSIYDRNQNQVASVTAPFVPGGAIISSACVYDGLNQLTDSATSTSGAWLRHDQYALDHNGNRKSVAHLDGSTDVYSMDKNLPIPGDFQADQYTITPFGACHYDSNGNLVEKDTASGVTVYHYDYADRLVRVELSVGAAMVITASFTYDVLGRRISKTAYPPAPAAPVTTQFVYDDTDDDCDGVLEEREAGRVLVTHLGGGASAAAYAAAGRTPFASINDLGQTVYYLTDSQQSVVAVTDAKGIILERCDYDDFGNPTFLSADGKPLSGSDGMPLRASPAGNPFLFHGLYWDDEISLYCGTRYCPIEGSPKTPSLYLDPNTGRSIAQVHNQAGVRGVRMALSQADLTGYAQNNPYNAKTVEKATSGLKDTLKTQVRMAPGGKNDIYVWKAAREEGGRHTPFQNK